MLALAGLPLGMRFRFLEPDRHCPAADLGDLIVGAYDDDLALAKFAGGDQRAETPVESAAILAATYEFENVPAHTARWLTEHVPVFPPERALEVAQDRLSEKSLFNRLGIETPRFRAVDSPADLHTAAADLGLPCVLKTRRLGYDGKGQSVLRRPADIELAWNDLGAAPFKRGPAGLILEAFVPFAREVSVIGVRSRSGETAFYPVVQNTHERGILVRSVAPAPDLSDAQTRLLQQATRRVLDELGYVGVLAIEYFMLQGGEILANEMAPRVHNSGHWTIEGAECSQFENHLRAVCGFPLGSTAPRGASIMLNIIGGEPDAPALLSIPGAHVHMYGKAPRPGRKLGHVTICGPDERRTAELAELAARALRNR